VIKTINQQTRSGREQPVEAPHSAKKRAYIAELRELAEHVRNRAVLYALGRPRSRAHRRLEKLKGRRGLL
jgi:hypothetical protein